MVRVSSLIMGIVIVLAQCADAATWQGHAGNAQHTAISPAPAQNLKRIAWTTPIDLKPQLTDGELLIHYGSPIITAANTLILAVKTGATDGFRIEARHARSGSVIWTTPSDYRFPFHDWIPSYSPVLTQHDRLYFAGLGGVIHYRNTPDLPTGTTGEVAFYGNAAYKANRAAYDTSVQITTPITADAAGNVYFGFTVSATVQNGLVSGIARVGADGKGTWISATAAAGDPTINKVQTNCAPAISSDQKTVYIAVSDGPSNGFSGYLLGLDAATLKPKYKVRLKGPIDADDAVLNDDSSASPTIGPDGDVFMGVLEHLPPYHNARGWLLHFDSKLEVTKVPGSFGWDETASILPASAVPSYKGRSKYLLMSKYNNYAGFGTGNGHNEIAILDPAASQPDSYSTSKVSVMKEVMTIAGPTPFPGGIPGQTYEWCIDTAAVDPATHSVFANSEDGHLYRWDLTTNTISQKILLNAPRPEAYTPTVVGADGAVYAINNATFYAVRN
jgi:hypothetical protein